MEPENKSIFQRQPWVAIYNSLIPVIGAVTSCMCLGEPFYWKYVVSGTMAAAGVYIIKGQRSDVGTGYSNQQ